VIKYLPVAISVLGAIVTLVSPGVQAFWAAHPEVAASVGGIVALMLGLLPSPLAQK